MKLKYTERIRILKGKVEYKVMEEWNNGILELWSNGKSKIIIDDKKL